MANFLVVYKRNLYDEKGGLHKDPYIGKYVIIYGISCDQIDYSVDQCAKDMSPYRDYLTPMSMSNGSRPHVDAFGKNLAVLAAEPYNRSQIKIPAEEFGGSREKALEWIYKIIEALPTGPEVKEEAKKVFATEISTFVDNHLLHPHGLLVIAEKLADLDAWITDEEILEMAKKRRGLREEVDPKFRQGFVRHIRTVPDRILFRWILRTLEGHKLIFT